MTSQFRKFLTDHFCGTIGIIFLKIMAQQSLPVSLKRIMDRMPVPVFHHICSGSQMAERLQAKLSVIRNPSRESLCFCFQNKIIIFFQRTGTVPAIGNLCTGQFVLGRMINVRTCYRQRLCRMFMIHHRLYSVGISPPVKIKVMGDKLIFPCILFHNIRLPLQIIIHQRSLELLELCAKASVDCSTHIREILPRVDPVTPVIQTKRLIHRIQIIVELCAKIFYKLLLHIFSCCIIIFCLIIQLETNHTFSVRRHFHQFSDHTFTVIAIYRMRDIHDLTRPVDARSPLCGCQYIRVGFYHPGRDRIRRCSNDH